MQRMIVIGLAILCTAAMARADGLTPAGTAPQGLCYASGASGPRVPCVLQGQTWTRVLRPTDDASGLTAPRGDGALQRLDGMVPALDIARAEIGSRTIVLRSFAASGYNAAGDAGAGARYVRGTSSGPLAVQDAAGTWWQLDLSGPVIPAGWFGVVANDQSKATQNGIGINAAMAALAARNGGTLDLPAGDVWTDRTLDNRYSHVLVRGQGRQERHDTGQPSNGTRIIPTGSAFTVLRHRTPTAAERGVPAGENWRTTGGGFDNLMVDGGGVAPRLLHVTSVTQGIHRVYLNNAVSPGTEAALYDSLPDYRATAYGQVQQMGEAGDCQANIVDLSITQDPGGNTGGLDGVNFGGVAGGGNASLMSGITLKVRYAKGVAVRLSNADNLNFNLIYLLGLKAAPSDTIGTGLLVQASLPGYGGGQITVARLSGGLAHVETLAERPGSNAVADLRIVDLDGGNGTPIPTGPNIKVDNTGYPSFATLGSTMSSLAVGDSVATAASARAYLTNNPIYSLVVANQSASGTAYLSNTTPYAQRVDPTTNAFQFLGPSTHQFRTDVGISGKVGFNDASPVGKCSLSAALPTDGSATNAAISTALNAVRSCLVTNGLGQ